MNNFNVKALQSLVNNPKFIWYGLEWEGLIWQDERPCPTKEEWETEKARLIAEQPLQDCKSKAKQLIANTDWSVLPDVNIINKSEFESYRNILRNYIINPIENPEFPIEPQPIWSVE
jgi:hypothetical protein